MDVHDGRRSTLRLLGAGGLGLLIPMSPLAPQQKEGGHEEIAPAEDLMREHGVLNRILLIYEEILRELASTKPAVNSGALKDSATIIRIFIEDYHEKLEEDYLFPRFEQAGKEVELVNVLRQQHHAGRKVTDTIIHLATNAGLKIADNRRQLSEEIHTFIRMYRPHEAREDTVLFPALHNIVSPHEYAALGEEFEEKEHELFGDEGFEKMVENVAGIERTLGIYELSKFTP